MTKQQTTIRNDAPIEETSVDRVNNTKPTRPTKPTVGVVKYCNLFQNLCPVRTSTEEQNQRIHHHRGPIIFTSFITLMSDIQLTFLLT